MKKTLYIVIVAALLLTSLAAATPEIRVKAKDMNASMIQERVMQMEQTTLKLQERLNATCEEKCYFQAHLEEKKGNLSQVDQVQEIKFLGLKVKAKNKFFVNEAGEIVKQRGNLFQVFYNWGIAKKFMQ